jgi:cysteine synthase
VLTSEQNWNAHVKWTGPQIYKQLPEINVICAGMGTSGTPTYSLYEILLTNERQEL